MDKVRGGGRGNIHFDGVKTGQWVAAQETVRVGDGLQPVIKKR